MSHWTAEEFRTLPLEEIDVRYARYRLSVWEAEETMVRSLRRYGQISPVVVCLREEVDTGWRGAKRFAAITRGSVFSVLDVEVDDLAVCEGTDFTTQTLLPFSPFPALGTRKVLGTT